MLSFDGIWTHSSYQCHKYITYSIFKNTRNSLRTKFWLLYKFVTATLKVSCKVFLHIPNAQDPRDMHSNSTLKSENPSSMRKLVGLPLHPDVQDEASNERWCPFCQHVLTKRPKAAENRSLGNSHSSITFESTHF